MTSKSYRFFKKFFYLILFSLVLLSTYCIYDLFSYLFDANMTFEFLIIKIFSLTTNSFFAVILYFFLKMIDSIEDNISLEKNIRYSQIIARLFIIIAILDFIYINISIDSTGIGLTSLDLDIDTIIIFSLFNYLVFSILPFIFNQLISSTNKYKTDLN